MPPMPYYLEKGPMLSVVESYLNSSTSNAVGEEVVIGYRSLRGVEVDCFFARAFRRRAQR